MSMDTSELLNRIRELYDQMDTVNTTMTTVNTTMGTVDTTINDLITALNNMSSKFTTPQNIDTLTSAFSTKFRFYHILTKSSVTNWAAGTYSGLTFDGTNWYAHDATAGDIDYWSGTTQSSFCTPTSSPSWQAWDWTNDQLYVLTDNEIELYNSSGVQQSSVALSHASWTLGDWTTKGFAHDNDNDALYAILYNSTTSQLTIESVNATTGALTESAEIDVTFNSISDMEILDEVIYAVDTTNNIILVYELAATTPYVTLSLTSEPRDLIAADKNYKTWHFLDDDPNGSGYDYIHVRGLAYVDRVSIEDNIVSSHMNYNTQTITTKGQAQIFAADASREAFELYNNSNSGILYVGSTTGVTTSNGRPVLPKQSLVIAGYSGAVHAIAETANCDVRYIELK